MSIFSRYGQTESPYVWVGDNGFIGMDARTAPDKLPEGVVSRAENVRMRTREVVTRPGNPYVNWFYPAWYPFDLEYGADGGLSGSWTVGGADADVVLTAGTSVGTPFTDGYEYLRFTSSAGSGLGLILKATGEETLGDIPVEPDYIASGQTVTDEPFVWVKETLGDENTQLDLTRGVINDAGQTPITCGEFRDPDGAEYAVIVTAESTWHGREYNRPFEVTIPDGVDDTAYLMQAFDELIMFRGKEQAPLIYSTAANSWTTITASSSGDYTLAIPNAERGLYFQNRTWVHVDDKLYIGDIGNATRYYWLENEFRINSGENDKITALFPFGKYAILIFKENSIHVLDNLYGDVIENMRARLISSRIGCVAPESIVNVGDSVWFCDQSGDVWDIRQVDEERMELSGEPVSWPIRPLMDEFTPSEIPTWAAAYHDAYYYLFWHSAIAPSDTKTSPTSDIITEGKLNRTFVYDTINKAWVSMDYDSNANMIGRAMHLTWMGEKRLMAVDRYQAQLKVIGYGSEDGTRPGRNFIAGNPAARIETRGYFAEKGSSQQFSEVRIQVGRYDNDIIVHTLKDGVNEETLLYRKRTTDQNRNTYLNASEVTGYAEWNPTNVNVDFLDPYRADYALYLPEAGTNGTYLQISTGLPTNQFQTYKLATRINETGNYLQLRIQADAGRFKIKDASVAVRKNMNLKGERV